MKNSLFTERTHIFSEVVSLAEKWKNAHDESSFQGGTMAAWREFQNTAAGKRLNEMENKLKDYLDTLNFDDIKVIKVVMYLGRDKDYDKSLSTEMIYNSYFDYFNNQGWASKEVEIHQLTGKYPLADYLKSGLNILEVYI